MTTTKPTEDEMDEMDDQNKEAAQADVAWAMQNAADHTSPGERRNKRLQCVAGWLLQQLNDHRRRSDQAQATEMALGLAQKQTDMMDAVTAEMEAEMGK